MTGFACGTPVLDIWLQKYAFGNQQAGMSSTYVCVDSETEAVLAYYALAFGGLSQQSATARVKKGIPRHEIPVIILARMAVCQEEKGKGLGRAMLRDAMIRVDKATEPAGIRCLVIHAKDESARQFYLACAEFEQSPIDPLNLQLLMKDLRLIVGS